MNAMIVPMPAAVPLMPLTDATDSLVYKSDGSTFAIVENAAYANVAKPNNSARTNRLVVKIVGINRVTPKPPKITTAFRAAPNDQPRHIRCPDIQPPKKFPRSAARKGTQ